MSQQFKNLLWPIQQIKFPKNTQKIALLAHLKYESMTVMTFVQIGMSYNKTEVHGSMTALSLFQ